MKNEEFLSEKCIFKYVVCKYSKNIMKNSVINKKIKKINNKFFLLLNNLCIFVNASLILLIYY